MFSEQLMKYILTYQKEEDDSRKIKQRPYIKIGRITAKKKYATVPIRITK